MWGRALREFGWYLFDVRMIDPAVRNAWLNVPLLPGNLPVVKPRWGARRPPSACRVV